MKKEIKFNIGEDFRKSILNIFDNNLMFAFICGSFAREREELVDDLDLFICLKKNGNDYDNHRFKKWYYEIHKKYKLNPDHSFPGELMTIDILLERLREIEEVKPRIIIKKKRYYDGIVWSGMLSGKYKKFAGNRPAFLRLRKRAKVLCNNWEKYIINNYKLKDSKNDVGLFLKKNIKILTSLKKNAKKLFLFITGQVLIPL